MRQFFTILLATLVGSICAEAQEKSGKEIEREIKLSGKYYYGEGLDSNLKSAQKNAFDDLKLMILEDLMENNEKLSTVDFNSFEDDIETVKFDLEGRVKVLMYLAKSDIGIENVSEQKVFVIRNTDEGVEVVQHDTEPTQPQPTQPSERADQSNSQTTIISGKPQSMGDGSTPTTPLASTTPPSQDGRNPNSASPLANSGQGASGSGDPIIDQLLGIRMYEEARQVLNNNKVKGKLMYGQIATMSTPSNCYFLVLRNREIIDILSKGDSPERKSLRTGSVVDYRAIQGTILWVNIL